MKWFTKTVTVEKIVEKVVETDRIVLGDASKADIYEAYATKREVEVMLYASRVYDKETHLGYFLSCAEAFKTHPGCKVRESTGIRIGNEYFVVQGRITQVTVTKPKRGKGKA